MNNHRTRTAAALIAACAIATLLAGCPQPAAVPTFTAGSGSGDVGRVTDVAGNSFDITNEADGSVRVDAHGPDGDTSFTLDGQGRLVAGSAPNGSMLDLTHNDDGSIGVVGVLLIDGQAQPFDGEIPAGTLPAAKAQQRSDGQAPLVVCVAINAFCASLPGLIDEIISIVVQEAGAQLGLPFPVPDFPTGVGFIDNTVRSTVRERFPVIVQIEGFCTVWELLDFDDICEQL